MFCLDLYRLSHMAPTIIVHIFDLRNKIYLSVSIHLTAVSLVIEENTD